MPEEMLQRSSITGIETDPLTARIAKALYPDADIREQPFEKIKAHRRIFRPRHFQCARLAITPFTTRAGTITNFPSTTISLPPRWTRCGRAACSCLSPRVTRWTNSIQPCVNCFPGKTEFLGAIRLPNTAFKKNAGTEVTTDIVMLRKLRPGEPPRGPAWKVTVDFTNDRQETFSINQYSPPIPK